MSTAHYRHPPIARMRHDNASRAANLGLVDWVFGATYFGLLFVALVRLLEVEQLQAAAAQVATLLKPLFSLVEAAGVSGTGVVACMLAASIVFALQQASNTVLRLLAGQPGRH